jgi:hypothetical protein
MTAGAIFPDILTGKTLFESIWPWLEPFCMVDGLFVVIVREQRLVLVHVFQWGVHPFLVVVM